MGIVVQFGRAGEIDMLLCVLTTAALACFELGRRRGSPVLQWFVPQLWVGLGVLAKIVAPAYFYPPALLLAWLHRREHRFPVVAFALGLLAMAAIVGAWLLAYAQRDSLAPLVDSFVSEVTRRFTSPAAPGSSFLAHVVRFPVEVVGAVLPWSLWLLALLFPWPRRVLWAARKDPLIELAALTAIFVVAGTAVAVGGHGRYLIPAYPFVALLAARVVRDLEADARARRESPPIGARRFVGSGRAFSWTLAAELLYMVIYVATTERLRARSGYRYRAEARQIAASIDRSLPVVIHETVPLAFVLPLYRELGVMPSAKPPRAAAYVLIAREKAAAPGPGGAVARPPMFRAWRIEPSVERTTARSAPSLPDG